MICVLDLKRVLSFPPYPGDYLHPVVYACTAVMLLCLLASIITYIVHHRVIRINRDGWHTLVNFLFHMGVTFSTFAAGINQINYPALCTLVGVIIHYASLSTMLWLLLTARNVCTDVSRPPTQTKTAVLRFYMFSNGVPLIVVGVTAAFGLDNYGSTEEALYCWMAWQPSLAAFYGPVALLVLVISIYFLCTYIQLKRHPERKYEVRIVVSNNKDKERHGGPPRGDGGGTSVLANEHSFKAQLRTTAITLLLFLATWALGALAVTQGHFLDMVFSCLYGAFCVTLGLFLLIQHCAKRDDVWTRWWACCSAKSEERGGQQRALQSSQQQQQQQQQQRYLDSPCSGKQPLLSPQLAHNHYNHHHHQHHHASSKTPPLPPLPPLLPPPPPRPLSPAGPCCVSRAASPRPQSLHDDLPRPPLPLQSCLKDRTKSRSFNRPRPCLRDLHGHMTSTSMDGGGGYGYGYGGPRLDSPHSLRGGLADGVAGCHSPQPPDGSLGGGGGGCDAPWMRAAHLPCPSPLPEKLLRRQSSCHSAVDPGVGSCQDLLARSAHADTISCHSTHFLPPQEGGHTCERRPYGTPKTEPLITTISRREISEPFMAQRQQVPETYGCGSKLGDEEEEEDDMLCPDEEQGVYPRYALPRPLEEEEQGVYPRCALPRPLEEEEERGVYPRCALPRPLEEDEERGVYPRCALPRPLEEEEERGVYPRCTLPRPRPALSRRSTISRNGSLQEDFLFGSDAAGNVRTGPWRNETAV